MDKKLSIKAWIGIILVGFIGQIAWAIENNYINLWVYSQTADVKFITWMTMASAVVAALTSFVMGVISDRLGKRKIFISGGYIIWGLTVILFGLSSYKNISALFPVANICLLVGIGNVITDCLMTFFGSTANDACFNAYVTDVTTEKNRNLVESILSVLPLFALGCMLVIGGIVGVPGSTNSGDLAAKALEVSDNWMIFFFIFGALTTLVGIISIFILPKDEIKPERKTGYFAEIIHGFKPSTIKQNKTFYLTLLAFLFFNIAIDSFMPYYLVYFTNDVSYGGLGLGDSYLPIMVIIMGLASISIICLGLFLERIGPLNLLIPSLSLVILGSSFFLIFKDQTGIVIAGILTIFGYLLGTTILGAKLRDETPKGEVGLFQGVRMIGTVMLPMIIGSELGKMSFNGASYETETGTVYAPTRWMFAVALGAALIALIPTSILYLSWNKKRKVTANIKK